jgi:enoyl-CoA hydratase/carnithine racemase
VKKTIRFERQGSVGRIVLANPPHNRLDRQFSECLRDAVHEAGSSDIRALVICAEGPHFSFGGEVREWPGKDIDWFRTFVAEVNASYRALEILPVPTVAAVRGVAFGGGFELALSCDFLVAADDATLCCVEVTTGFIPIAGALQRLAERVGRARASQFAMLGEPIPGKRAGELGIATHVVASANVDSTANELAANLSNGPTRAYAAVRTLLKAWSAGGVPAADAVMLDITMPLHGTEDVTRGFVNTAEAFDKDIAPPPMIFYGR